MAYILGRGASRLYIVASVARVCKSTATLTNATPLCSLRTTLPACVPCTSGLALRSYARYANNEEEEERNEVDPWHDSEGNPVGDVPESCLLREPESDTLHADLEPGFEVLSRKFASPSRLVHDIFDAVEGIPRDPAQLEELMRILNESGLEDSVKNDVMRILDSNKEKYGLDDGFREFAEIVYGYKGPDKEVLILSALVLHAQLVGSTKEGDPIAVSTTMPLLKKIAFEPLKETTQKSYEMLKDLGEEKANDVLSAILEKLGPHSGSKMRLEDLRYLKIYPKQVRKWVEDAKTPVGIYDESGMWVPIKPGPVSQQAVLAKQAAAAEQYKALIGRKLGRSTAAVPILPDDLKGHYRFGLTQEEIDEIQPPEKLLDVLSFAHATTEEINKFRIQQAVKRWQRFPGDTGSDEVQGAVLSVKILYMTEHFKRHIHDHSRRRQFQMMVVRRQKIFNRLKKNNTAVYYDILDKLQLPDTGRTFRVGHVGGISVPKKCRLSARKQQRFNKGKSISQKAIAQRRIQLQ